MVKSLPDSRTHLTELLHCKSDTYLTLTSLSISFRFSKFYRKNRKMNSTDKTNKSHKTDLDLETNLMTQHDPTRLTTTHLQPQPAKWPQTPDNLWHQLMKFSSGVAWGWCYHLCFNEVFKQFNPKHHQTNPSRPRGFTSLP